MIEMCMLLSKNILKGGVEKNFVFYTSLFLLNTK